MVIESKNQNKDKVNDKVVALLEDLAFLESYIKDLFSFLPLPVCLVSSLGVILDVNPAFEKISGYPNVEIIGRAVEGLFHKEEIEVLYRETETTGFVKAKEIKLVAKDQKEIFVSAATTLRKSEAGEIIGYFIGLFDLTDIKKYEKELQEAKKVLEVRVRELEKFQRLTVGRELEMIELKKNIEKLKEQIRRYSGSSTRGTP